MPKNGSVPRKKSLITSIRLAPDVLAKLRQIARDADLPLSRILGRAAEEFAAKEQRA